MDNFGAVIIDASERFARRTPREVELPESAVITLFLDLYGSIEESRERVTYLPRTENGLVIVKIA